MDMHALFKLHVFITTSPFWTLQQENENADNLFKRCLTNWVFSHFVEDGTHHLTTQAGKTIWSGQFIQTNKHFRNNLTIIGISPKTEIVINYKQLEMVFGFEKIHFSYYDIQRNKKI